MTTDPKDPRNAFQRVDLEVRIARVADVLRAHQHLYEVSDTQAYFRRNAVIATELNRLLDEWMGLVE